MTQTPLTIIVRMTCVSLLVLWAIVAPVAAETIVLANRSPTAVHFAIVSGPDSHRPYVIVPGQVLAVPVDRVVTISFEAGNRFRAYELDVNSAYFFHGGSAAELDLERIGLGKADSQEADQRSTAGADPVTANWKPVVTPGIEPFKLPVKLLVDDEERAARPRWEGRLHQRLAAASEILEQHCGVGFRVMQLDVWESDDTITEFSEAFREFKGKVNAGSARIAIGFTSQYSLPQGRTNLGGTQGPLDSHILIREWSQHISEPERTELLVHELGHFLGAVHSPEPDSVMRPILGDRQSLARGFRIGFDPLNTLAMSLVGAGLREQNVRDLRELPPASRRRLNDIYSSLVGALPDDPAAGRYRGLLAEPAGDSAQF